VGYGDFGPKTAIDRLATCVIVSIGFVSVYGTITGAMNAFMANVNLACLKMKPTKIRRSTQSEDPRTPFLRAHFSKRPPPHPHRRAPQQVNKGIKNRQRAADPQKPLPADDGDVARALAAKKLFFLAMLVLVLLFGTGASTPVRMPKRPLFLGVLPDSLLRGALFRRRRHVPRGLAL
jgi:hypothetical protein